MPTVTAEEYERLQVRSRKLARDKSYLQLIINLMNKVATASGLVDAIDCMLCSIVDVLGGDNVVLYYTVDDGLFSVDVLGNEVKLDRVDDPRVQQVFDSREHVEFARDCRDTGMTTREFAKAYTWIYPLLVGPELVGVLKMESLHIDTGELRKYLPTFFSFAALILKNNRGAESLRESEEKFRTLVTNLNTGVFRTTYDLGRFLQANPALADMFGYDSLDEFMARTIADFYGIGEERGRVLAEIRQYGSIRNLELHMRKRDGALIRCSLSATAQYHDNGDIKWVDGVIDDITERKRDEEAIHLQAVELEEEVAERQLAQESLQKQAVLLEQEINQRRKAQDELGRLNETLEQRVQTRTAELRERTAEVEKAYEDLKRVQGQLLQQDKMASIGQLAAGVAHEINNPMGFIISNLGSLGRYCEKLGAYLEAQEQANAGCDAAVREILLESRRTHKVDRILGDLPDLIGESLEGAERVRKIVQELKNFSRLDRAEFTHADINAGLESTLSIVWNELKYKATVFRDFGRLPQVWCNPGQLNQVFLNILVNAAQAIEGKGEIRIATSGGEGSVRIVIGDTGRGISPENLKRIFDPFFTTKEVGKGTGLGLAIAYDIVVNKHGGSIEVESGVGIGTTFMIALPLKEPAHPAEHPAAASFT